MKKCRVIAILATLIISTAIFSGCGNNSETISETSNISTSDTATIGTTEAEIEYETVAMDDTDKAIVEAGLKVDDNGNITDKDGNKVEKDEDGNVTVKTEDGKTVTVSTAKVDSANKANDTNEANKAAAIANANANSNSKGSSSSSSSKNSSSSSSASSKSSSSSSSSSSKTSSSSSSSSSSSKNSSSSSSSSSSKTSSSSSSSSSSKNSSSSSSSSSSKTNNSSSSATSDPHAGKTYHEAVTTQVWVVDKAAYSYEEPVYEYKQVQICKDCGCVLTGMSMSELYEHLDNHILNEDGDGGYYSQTQKVQTGTKTINVPEEGHYETKVVKEAGWY